MASPHASGSSHDEHDRLLLAAFAAGDVDGEDLAKAIRLSEACESCGTLVAELRAVARAVASMPPPRRAGRDFRISAEQAHRLGRRAGWRRLLRPFATRRASILGPVAATLMTLGFAGMLFSAGGSFLAGAGGTAGGNAALGPTTASTVPESTGRSSVDELDVGAVRASTAPGDQSSGGGTPPDAGETKHATPEAAPPAPDRTWWVAVSGILVVLGAGAFTLRRLALRDR